MVNEILDLLIHITFAIHNRSRKVGQQLASRARIQYTETITEILQNIIKIIQTSKPRIRRIGEGQICFSS